MRLSRVRPLHFLVAGLLVLGIWSLQRHKSHAFNASKGTIPSDWSKGSLRDRLIRTFDTAGEGIPNNIWQSWKSTKNLDTNFQKNTEKWSSQEGLVYHLLDDDEVDQFVLTEYRNFPEILKAWNLLPRKILKADYFRYLVLLAKGGYYSDIDTYPTTNLSQWIAENSVLSELLRLNSIHLSSIGVIIGIEEELDLGTWRGLYNRRVNLCQWTMASKPGHPLFADVVTKIADLALKYYNKTTNVITFPLGYKNLGGIKPAYNMSRDSENWYEGIIEWTGPASFTDSFFHVMNKWFLENFELHSLNQVTDSICNDRNVCIIDPNRPLNLVSNLVNYPLGDNLLGTKYPNSPVGWENFTLLEYPLLYGDVVMLPKHYFNSLYATDNKKGYVHHSFTGTWKWTKDP